MLIVHSLPSHMRPLQPIPWCCLYFIVLLLYLLNADRMAIAKGRGCSTMWSRAMGKHWISETNAARPSRRINRIAGGRGLAGLVSRRLFSLRVGRRETWYVKHYRAWFINALSAYVMVVTFVDSCSLRRLRTQQGIEVGWVYCGACMNIVLRYFDNASWG